MAKENEKKLFKIQKDARSLMITNEVNISSQLNLLYRSKTVGFAFLCSSSKRTLNELWGDPKAKKERKKTTKSLDGPASDPYAHSPLAAPGCSGHLAPSSLGSIAGHGEGTQVPNSCPLLRRERDTD